jgi:NADPH:quinone reductase-like Zn-dependent oxidoreductase
MKAIRIHGFGGPEVLQLDDVPIPQPGEDELLVRIRAASVNPVDYKIRRGTVPWVSREMLPIILGRDLSGTVEGAGVGCLRAGRGRLRNARRHRSGQLCTLRRRKAQ